MLNILNNSRAIACTVACTVLSSLAYAGYTTTTNFVDPDGWAVGAANSTYQEWDNLPGATPDIGYSANPAISEQPTVAPTGSGFGTSSGNYYSFMGNYGFAATIYNHGGEFGTGGLGATMGTQVIIQASSTVNEGTGIFPNSIQLWDPNNLASPLTGGDNASALQNTVIFSGIVGSSQGDVTYEELLWEFYLPNYTGDILITGDVMIHASLDRLRVDTGIASSAFSPTQVPEPSTYAAIFGLITLGIVYHRRKSHS